MIRLGARIDPSWLERPTDLAFLRAIGVEFVDVEMGVFSGFKESGGALERSAVGDVVDRLRMHGLQIERANYTKSEVRPQYLGQPAGKAAIENICRAAELLGEFEIPVFGLQCFDASVILGRAAGAHSWRKGRGDYEYLHIDVAEDRAVDVSPSAAPTHAQLWERTLEIFEALMPVADSAGLRVATHGSDPPIETAAGVPQMLTSFADFDLLFRDAPSPNNGMTFCVGTRYESGEDVFEGIRRFGGAGRIFHVHFRNVRGTIPSDAAYAEVAPDEGDLEMLQVLRALDAVGYDGVIDYDHLMKLPGGDPAGRDYMAFCVGHMRGLIEAL